MMFLINPAVRLMDRMRFAPRFIVIGAAFTLLLAALLTDVVWRMHGQLELARAELKAVPTLLTVRRLIDSTQRHRGLTVRVASGDASAQAQYAARTRDIEAVLAELAGINGLGEDAARQLATVREAWTRLQAEVGGMSIDHAFLRHTALVALELGLLDAVAAESRIALDPEAETNFLGNAAIAGFLPLTERLGRLRALAAALAARGDVPDAIQKRDLRSQIQDARMLLDATRRVVSRANALRPAPVLDRQVDAAREAIQRLEAFLEAKVLGDAVSAGVAETFDITTAAVDSAYAVFDATLAELGERFTAREAAIVRQASGVVGGIVFALALLSWLSLGSYLSLKRGVHDLSEGGRRIAGGDLSARVNLRSRDELGDVARLFDQMAAALADMVRGIQSDVREVTAAADKLAAVTERGAEAAQRQSEAAASSAAAVEQVAAGIDQVADHAGEVDRGARDSLDQTRRGTRTLEHMVGEIAHVEGTVQRMAGAAREFVASAHDISRMTGQVRDLADQTNLLALNAAIEAARAGEQGRGFAVVADEVRKLAEKSAAAAAEIDRITRALEDRTRGVEELVEESLGSLTASQGHMQSVSAVLGEASTSVSHTAEGMDRILASVKEQSAATAEIGRNTERIAEMTERSLAVVGEAAHSAQGLHRVADRLSLAAARFTT